MPKNVAVAKIKGAKNAVKFMRPMKYIRTMSALVS